MSGSTSGGAPKDTYFLGIKIPSLVNPVIELRKQLARKKEIQALAKRNDILLEDTQTTVAEIADLEKENAGRRMVKRTQPLLPYQSVWIDTVDDDGKYTWREHYEWTKEYNRKLEEHGVTLEILQAERKDNDSQIHKLEMLVKTYRPPPPIPQVDWSKPPVPPFQQFPKPR
jgi:hypothetical protein